MSKNYKKLIFFFLILIVFFLGILTERFDVDKKISKNLEKYTDRIYQFVYSVTNKEKKVYIYIEPRHYRKILNIRDLSINKTMLTKELEDWVPARINLKNNSKNIKIKIWFDNLVRKSPDTVEKKKLLYLIKDWIPSDKISKKNAPNIKIRLKGVWPDHWSDDKQWSFKIKFINEEDQIFNLNRLALQPPITLDYIYEWLLSEALEAENLISLPVSFTEVIINNKSRGLYTAQGQISEKILKRNKKPLSPIIGFSKDTWIKEQINSKRLLSLGATDSLNGLEDTFLRSRIDPVRFDKFKNNPEQVAYLKNAIYLLESFRSGEKKTSEVFDIKKLAKVMALRALIGSSEFDYLDTKFYYNHKTSLLEPISKEAHVNLSLDWKNKYYSWWIDSFKSRSHYTGNKNIFIDLLYKDKKFYEEYLKQLNYYSSNNFYTKLIENNKKEFDNNINILKNNFPTKKIFSYEHLMVMEKRVQDLLSPIEGLNSYFEDFSEGIVKIKIQNIQRLPIKVTGLRFDDGAEIIKEIPIIIDGKQPLKSAKTYTFEVDCKNSSNCDKNFIQNQKILYRVLGQSNERLGMIQPFYYSNKK